MSFSIRWFGVSCFEIKCKNGLSIVVDPYIDDSVSCSYSCNEISNCDIILVSHGHYDHVLDVGKLVRRLSPSKIYCSDTTTKAIIAQQGVKNELFRTVTYGENIKHGSVTIEVVKGVHNNFKTEYERLKGEAIPKDILASGNIEALKYAFRELSNTSWLPNAFDEWMNIYPGGEQLNFIITFGSGEKLYIAGSYPDPKIINEAKMRPPVDLMLIQVMSGIKINGIEKETFDFANAAGCGMVIPHHFDQLLKGAVETDLTKLKQLFSEFSLPFIDLEIGVWYEYEKNREGHFIKPKVLV